MSSKGEKQLIWHPRRENKFIVGGGSQIGLYEWVPDALAFRLLTSQTDLLNMKCFAWSPDPQYDDLVAVGTSSGKVDLLRMESARLAKNSITSSGAVGHISVRSASRGCNSISFSSINPKLLAVGYDKLKGDSSLVIWDIANATSAPASSGKLNPSSVVQQYGGDVVTSVQFLHETPHIVAAGVAGNWLRLFDLRVSTSHCAQAQCKVQGFTVDPLNERRFASYGDGMVSVWDSRSLNQPLLAFTSKDAFADGAGYHQSDLFCAIEFSSVRSGVLGTLLKDANHVRFWDVKSTPPMTDSAFEARALERQYEPREGSRTRKLSRLSWTTPSTILPWATQSEHPVSPAMSERTISNNTSHAVLANTHRTKSYNRPIMSFALVPTSEKVPTTSNIVVVGKEGDIEMHSMFDSPKHIIWSPRGDLVIGVGDHFAVHGLHDALPVVEPWQIEMDTREKENGQEEKSLDRRSVSKHRKPHSRTPSPGFGRGDKDGFPALVSKHKFRGTTSRASSPAPGKLTTNLTATYEPLTPESPSTDQSPTSILPKQHIRGKLPRVASHGATQRGRRRPHHSGIPALESDVMTVMKTRVLRGYGLSNVPHNVKVLEISDGDNSSLQDIWRWINHSRRVLSFNASTRVHGIDFAYQGVLGIMEGLETITPPELAGHLESLDLAGTTGSPTYSQGELTPGLDMPSTVASPFFSSRSSSVDALHGNYIAALNTLNVQCEVGAEKGIWKPAVHSVKSANRRLALALVDFRIGDDMFSRWEREGKHAQAACWLLFTNQGARAIDVLMRSKSETHQMMSGTLAVLLQAGSSSKNHELHNYSSKLINRLQDPHFRIMVSYIVFNDWSDVMEEEALPLRERLAIALRFLDDKTLTAYLRRVADNCRKHGDIEGLFVSGLTPRGLDILQSYVDMTGDVQTVALLSSFVCPGRSHDIRAERWIESYHDLLDGWKLFHFRCQFDIDRGRLLQGDINSGDVLPMEWVKKQFLIRCNFCNKIVNSRRVHESAVTQRRRPASCPSCGRALPRCSVCLMSMGIISDTDRDNAQLHSSFRDTPNDAFIFCQACRHGGHAAHIIEWFFGDGDESRPRRTCPVAGCDCFCDQEY